MIDEKKPVIIFSFGAFAYEFGRRALDISPSRPFRYWNTHKLGDEFRTSINSFNVDNINLIPLLHKSIAGGRFLESHRDFCGKETANYFDYVGKEIATVIIKNKDKLNIWI